MGSKQLEGIEHIKPKPVTREKIRRVRRFVALHDAPAEERLMLLQMLGIDDEEALLPIGEAK